MSFVFIGVGFMGFLAATTLAIDVGMLMTARSQAQNAADAGALAGAVGLVFNSYTDRSASGPAVQGAIHAAQANSVISQQVSVTPDDVTFLNDETGAPNRIRVTVYRTAGRGNPLTMLMGPMFGVTNANVGASATAEVAPTNAATCVLPFAIPDKWVEGNAPPWDTTDTYTGSPDVYRDPWNANPTGYRPWIDSGSLLTLKAGTGNNIAPGLYFALSLTDSMGSDDFRWNIPNCNTTVIRLGDTLIQEPGNQVGPSAQGFQQLIDRDPGAYWDGTKVVSTQNPSPRVKAVPLFDPAFWWTGKQNGRYADMKAVNFLGFFVETVQGNDIKGRIVPATAMLTSTAGPAPVTTFTRSIRLVE